MQIKHELFGIRFERRADHDPHVKLQLLIEDDENWHKHGGAFSSHWLDELISVLESARIKLKESFDKDPSGYGYRFVETPK